MDLEYILSVISDGPAKSFAYRRIKYLESRWNLYCLLNEYQELAEMKVSDFQVIHFPAFSILMIAPNRCTESTSSVSRQNIHRFSMEFAAR